MCPFAGQSRRVITRLRFSSSDPRLGGLAKHHPANAGDGQDHSHDIGLAPVFRQQVQRAGHAPGAADQVGADGLDGPLGSQFFHGISPQKSPQERGRLSW